MHLSLNFETSHIKPLIQGAFWFKEKSLFKGYLPIWKKILVTAVHSIIDSKLLFPLLCHSVVLLEIVLPGA